mmetsp:Transcript_6184/g.15782  ORF Transcript_6184/g.15782 Transcript_6184/m.15782 type:complete len:176 (-) Transcript_6184:592-1119(-)
MCGKKGKNSEGGGSAWSSGGGGGIPAIGAPPKACGGASSSLSGKKRAVSVDNNVVENKKATSGGDGGGDFDLDALFSKGKAVKKQKDAVVADKAAVAATTAARDALKERPLLPGQKKSKGKRDKPEFEPVAQPRRFEDGLPVYKSYGDFSDMSFGQTATKDKPPGKCPFECWCCF